MLRNKYITQLLPELLHALLNVIKIHNVIKMLLR